MRRRVIVIDRAVGDGCGDGGVAGGGQRHGKRLIVFDNRVASHQHSDQLTRFAGGKRDRAAGKGATGKIIGTSWIGARATDAPQRCAAGAQIAAAADREAIDSAAAVALRLERIAGCDRENWRRRRCEIERGGIGNTSKAVARNILDYSGGKLDRISGISGQVQEGINRNSGTNKSNLTCVCNTDRSHIQAIRNNNNTSARLDSFRKIQNDIGCRSHQLSIVRWGRTQQRWGRAIGKASEGIDSAAKADGLDVTGDQIDVSRRIFGY